VLKARACYTKYAKKHSVPHKKIGKLIVATSKSELGALEGIFKKGERNNVTGLTMLTAADVRKIEPNVNAVAAISLRERES